MDWNELRSLDNPGSKNKQAKMDYTSSTKMNDRRKAIVIFGVVPSGSYRKTMTQTT